MTFDELESELVHLVSLPLKKDIRVDFDQEKEIFSLSVSIFQAGVRELPLAVQKYVSNLDGMTFRPHSTSYQIRENQVFLVQEFSFAVEGQFSLRKQLAEFGVLSQKCHTMLCEIAADEKLELFSL